MNWVWGQRLTPAVKMVLLALADAADDEGVCWPSVPTLAGKCCISTRTVRCILQELVANGLLQAEARFRVDGSATSNRYKLPIDRSDKLSGAMTPMSPLESPLNPRMNHHHHGAVRPHCLRQRLA